MTDRKYGGFWRRFFAFLIDKVILYVVSLILFLIGLLAMGLKGDMMSRAAASPEDIMQGVGAIWLIYLTASFLAGMTYFTWFHGIGGRTPGKMLLGLRVIQASGDPMTPGLAFLRCVGYLISGLVFGLGFLWIAFDGRKQGWHDKIAATLVIRERRISDRDTHRSFTEYDAGGKTAPDGGAIETPSSVPEPVSSLPRPEERQE